MPVPSLGGLELLSASQNPNPMLAGIQQGLQAAYLPQQMQSEIAKNNAMAQYNQLHGAYFDPNSAFRQSQIQQNQSKAGMYDTASDKNVANTNQINQTTQPKVENINSQTNLNNQKANVQPTIAATNQAKAAKTYQDAINLGLDPDQAMQYTQHVTQQQPSQQLPISQPQASDMSNKPTPTQIQAMGPNNQPTIYDNSKNFGLWDPTQQDQYVANNNKIPALPKGTTLNLKPDQKTVTKINALPVVAPSVVHMKNLLNDPEVTPYLGSTGKILMDNIAASTQGRLGNYPSGYKKAQTLYRLSNSIIDTLATSQTGSRNLGAMNQFNDAFNPKNALDGQQANDALSALSQTLYDEGKVYVGQNYLPGLRQTAFNGVKQLQQAGLTQEGSSMKVNSQNKAPTFTDKQIQDYANRTGKSVYDVKLMLQAKNKGE